MSGKPHTKICFCPVVFLSFLAGGCYQEHMIPESELRKTVVLKSDEEFAASIGSMIDLENAADHYYKLLNNSGAIERENKRWADVDIDLAYEYAYICNWIEQRLIILDETLYEEPE